MRLSVICWRRTGGAVRREERGDSQKRERECCEDGEVNNVPGMRVNRIPTNGLDCENDEINGKEYVEKVGDYDRRGGN